MRLNIAEYESWAKAERAVRALEARFSTQNLVIGDQSARWWKWRDRRRDRSLDREHGADFVVSMSGTRAEIERARALLRTAAALHSASR